MSGTDQELWPAVVSGDAKAWGVIVKRYQSLVYAVATRAGLSQVDAADCFQQTWLLLYNNRRKLNDPSRLSAWLVTTAKREALRLKRRLGNDPGEEATDEAVDGALLPDDELIALERQSQLESAIAQLDRRCQDLVDAFFFADEEQSYEAIAQSLGIAANSLGPIRRRCLERLKRILEQNGHLEVRNADGDAL
ncbi:MAG: sigma-70 family RNA polymerase sigma factor [candidate division Zixibacteria bacterium]|nr:sigma-70 family RNA polymerase sigma factor [candidate division Zixibacteria bacterium]